MSRSHECSVACGVVLDVFGHQQVSFHSLLIIFLDSGSVYVYELQGLPTSSV